MAAISFHDLVWSAWFIACCALLVVVWVYLRGLQRAAKPHRAWIVQFLGPLAVLVPGVLKDPSAGRIIRIVLGAILILTFVLFMSQMPL